MTEIIWRTVYEDAHLKRVHRVALWKGASPDARHEIVTEVRVIDKLTGESRVEVPGGGE